MTAPLVEGYRISKDQGFGTSIQGEYQEAQGLLNAYCGTCRLESKCRINLHLRQAMGENFPYWSKSFVTLENTEDDDITKIFCREFELSERKAKVAAKEVQSSI